MQEPIRKTRVRYDFNRLKTFCEEQGIELLHNYENKDINRDTVLEGKCKTEDCGNICKKKFERLLESGCFCKSCTFQKSREHAKQTCMEKYGVEHALQLQEVKDKIKKLV